MIKQSINIGNDLYLKGRIGWQGLSKDEYLSSGNYKIINATAIMDGYIDWNNCGYITKERYEEAKEIQLKVGDILISKDGTIGKVGIIKHLDCPCSVASGIFVLRNTKPEILDTEYLYYYLISPIFKNFIDKKKSFGSTIHHLYQSDLSTLTIKLPTLETQRKISNILSQIDQQVQRNNSMVHKLQLNDTTISCFSMKGEMRYAS